MARRVSHACQICGKPAYYSNGHGWRKYCLPHLKQVMNEAAEQMRQKKGPIWDRWVAAQKAYAARFQSGVIDSRQS